MTLTHAQELRALSELRDVYFRQSEMTVFGTVPPMSSRAYEPDHVDPAYFTEHSYSDLSQGF